MSARTYPVSIRIAGQDGETFRGYAPEKIIRRIWGPRAELWMDTDPAYASVGRGKIVEWSAISRAWDVLSVVYVTDTRDEDATA